MKKRKKIIILICIATFLVWMLYTNLSVAFTHYAISFDSLPKSFEGFKIAHISDFHNAKFGNAAESIVDGIKEEKPDIIAITGDLIDSSNINVEVALNLVKGLVEIAPCYYVTGNHESWLDNGVYQILEDRLTEYGVVILRDSEVLLSKGDEKISLIGVDDPDYADSVGGMTETMSIDKINELSSEGLFSIMLSHRPEYYRVYETTDVNLILSGHAHGGQFRIPFVGGLVAPNQGLLPEYDSGVYQEDEFAMVVSRGIGNSIIPVRFNNQPEVIIVELRN
ncbi:MAG TPA: phosphoesterase [Clostridiales bacterium]|nr:metallophosphoesterase [Clostridia bacterium]HCS74500.1 phosphoesterase [Clostridiales bacterium]